jgi:glutathione S-transferase
MNQQELPMAALPRITTFAWVPEFARGFVRDLRPRWAFEEVGQPYEVDLIQDGKTPEHLRVQPFGQVPTYRDEEVEMFESGAIVVRIAERAGKLIPTDPAGRMKAYQWVAAALNTMEPAVLQFATNEVFEADRAWSAERRPIVRDRIDTRLRRLDDYLDDREWLEGNEFTVGDLLMISVVGGLRGRNVIEAFPRVAAYVARGEARPAYRKAMADHLATFAEPVAA